METRKTGLSWLAGLCAAVFMLTAFAAGAWAGNSAAFVSKTVADNTNVTGGKSFRQEWTIQNTGTKTWDSDYKLRYKNGDLSSSHSSIKISGKVKPGKTYTFSMEMKAPAAKSTEAAYREEWKFGKSSDSTLVKLWTQIVVPKAVPVVTDDYGNNCSTAAGISLNSSKNGKIDFAGDNDYFKVSLSSRGTLKVYTTGSTDTYGRLFDSSCKEIKHDDDDGKGDNFSISKSVSAGTYYVAVRHHSSTKTGSYTLNLNKSESSDSGKITASDLKFPCLLTGWSHTSGSNYHKAGGGYKGMNDTNALDLNRNAPSRNLDAGMSVYPVASGKVVATSSSLGFVLIQHTQPLKLDDGTILNNWYSGYMHMTNIVANNTSPITSTVLGKISRVGMTVKPNDHLHFAIYSGNHANGYKTLTSINTRTKLQAFAAKITYWY